MKLPWRRHAQKSGPSGSDVTEEVERRPVIHPSPGFEAVLAGPEKGPPRRILDIGPLVPENIAYLAGFASRIQILDAFRDSLDPVTVFRALDNLGPEFEGAFDVVLLWDALNYMSTDQGAALIQAVVPLLSQDARCLALVAASDSMAAAPNTYRVVDSRHLAYETTSAAEIGAPQMTPAAVERIFTGFSIDHAFVLRNGVREFVAVRDPDSAI